MINKPYQILSNLPSWIIFVVFVNVLICNSELYGQKIATFQKSFGGNSDDIGSSVVYLPDGGDIIAGVTKSFGSGGYDILLVRTDSLGKKIWAKTYGGSSDEGTGISLFSSNVDIIMTPDSNILVCSNTESFGAGDADVYLLKIDLNGNLKWSKTYGGTDNDYGVGVMNDPNGGILIVGQTYSFGPGNGDVLLIKTDTAGGIIWAKAYGNSSNEEVGYKITSSLNGNFLICGYSNNSSTVYNQMVMKVDKNGKLLFDKVYGTSSYDIAQSLIELPDSSLYMGGFTKNPFNGANTLATLCKLDKSGNLIWCKIYDKSQHSAIGTLLYDKVKKVINCKFLNISNNQQRFGLMRIDTSGKIIFTRTFGPSSTTSNYTSGFSDHELIEIPSGGYIMNLATNVFGYGGWDYFYAKIDTSGKTNNCNTVNVSMTPFLFNSYISDYTYSFSTSSVSPSTGNGSDISAADVKDTLVCGPFITNFRLQNPCANQAVSFFDSSYYKPSSWKWNFGDGSSLSKFQNPSHVYKAAGSYTVKLISSNGLVTDSISKIITIFASPAHQKTSTSTICIGDSLNFNITGSGGKSFSWNLSSSVSDSSDSTVWAYPYEDADFIAKITNTYGCYIYDSFIVKIDTSSKCAKSATIGGVINNYASVSAYDSCYNTFTVDTSSFFKVGSRALLIQIKGATIDTSGSSFGSIVKIGDAGNYEYVTIDSVSGLKVYLRNTLLNSYDINGLVQLVTVPQYTNVIVSKTLNPQPWNGKKGGIMVFEATGNLYLSANIDASGKGFSGGIDLAGSASKGNCDGMGYYYNSSSTSTGSKGEGVAPYNNAYYSGRGANINGGGGGNNAYSGGAGGGSYAPGGSGGIETSACSSPISNGGIGGIGLSTYIKQNRVFLGGGGGAKAGIGQVSSEIANGGGIVFIKANEVISNGFSIKSNGIDQTASHFTVGSGGGAGGAILANISNYPLKVQIQANGGKGEDIFASTCAGPGGGGGGGALLLNSSLLPKNLIWSSKPGLAGLNLSTSSSCYNTSYGADSGRSGGVITNASIPQGNSSFIRPYAKITTISRTICIGDSVQLSASVAGLKSISWSPSGTVKNPNATGTSAFPTTNTLYKLTAFTSGGCTLHDSVIINVFPTKPVTPTITNSTVTDNADIQLNIFLANFYRVAYVTTYVSIDGGAYTKVAETTSLAKNLTVSSGSLSATKHRYTYVAIATDSCGNNSDSSVKHSPVLLEGTAGNLQNILHWKNYIGHKVDSIIVQRLVGGSGSWQKISKPKKTDTTFTDNTYMKCGIPLSYRIITYDSSLVSLSDTITLTPYDTILPVQVNILSASVTSGSNISLQFNKVPKKTTRKYLIYTKKNSGTFVLLDSVLAKSIKTSSYTYNYNINTLSDTFAFEIFALDSCGNESQTTEMHRDMQLNGKALEDSATLSWSNYLGFNVKNYVLQKWSKTSGWTDYKTLTSTDSSFKELEHCNAVLNFRIKAVENGGDNAIAYSDSIQLIPFDTVPPPKDSMISASVVDGSHINLIFNKVTDADVIGYVIYRSKNHGSFIDIDTIKRPATGPVSFMDNINTLTDTFSYGVYAFDSCGNTSLTTQTHRAIQLNGKALDDSSYLSWSQYEGFNVSSYTVQTRTKNTGWSDTYTGVLPSTSAFIAPGSCNDTFYYRIKAIENGGTNAIVYSDSIAITPFDTIRPDKPTIAYVTALDNKTIQINWTRSSSNDVKNYNLYRDGIKIASLGNVATYSDTGINTTKSYCYAVEAQDSCAGNLSGLSQAHCSVALNTSINGCEKSIYLSWNKYSGWSSVKKYEIYRTVNGGSESLLTSVASSITSFKDSLLNYHDSYCYRILAYDNTTTNTSWSNQGCNHTFFVDTAKIITTTKATTSTTNGTVVIRWKNINTPHLAYHTLYYSADGISYSILKDSISPTIDSFVHTGINTQSADQYYYLITTDSCGTRSDSSAIHKTITLTVSVGELLHKLNWTKYNGFKVRIYDIQKLEKGVFKTIDSVAANDTATKYFPAPCNSVERYRIIAFGYNPGEVSLSDTMGRQAIDTIPSDAPVVKNATVVNGTTTKIDFIGSDSLDTYDFVIQRSTDGNWNTAGNILFTTPGKALTYIDSVVNTQKQHLCYTIIARDSCLNATPSDTFCVIGLRGSDENLSDSLKWYPFQGYGIREYDVLHYNSSSSWDTLARLSGTDTAYLHIPLPCDVSQTYKIEGFENGGNRVTMSDSITLTPFDTIKPPGPIIKLATVLDDSHIQLSWHKSISKVKLYELSMKTGNGNWKVSDTVLVDTSFTYSGLNTPDSVYDFRIVAIDSCAFNRSLPSVFHSPIQLGGKGQNLSNLLTWKKYEGWNGVREYYIYQFINGSWIKIDSVDGNTHSYLHKPLPCDVTQAYKVTALDSSRQYMSYSDTVQLTPFDTIKPPEVVIKYATVLNDNQVELFWAKSVPKVKLYELSMKTGNGTWQVTDTVKIDTSFIYNGLNTPDSVYDFRIVAIDSCARNRSQPSIIHSPIQLSGQDQNLSNLLTWKKYEGWKGVYKYYIYEQVNHIWQKIDSVSGTTLSYLHKPLPCDVTQAYEVAALDSTGKYLSYSDTVQLTPYDTIKPPAPVIKYATVLNGTQIALFWHKSIPKVKLYELSVKTGKGTWQATNLVNVDTSFIFSGLNTLDSVYDFRIVAIDSCAANRSPYSTIHSPVKIYGTALDDSIALNWKPYEGFSAVSKYYVYQYVSSKWTILDSVSGTDTVYKTKTLPCNVAQAYRVGALDSTTPYLSQSDTISVTPFDTIKPAAPTLYYATVLPSQSIKLAWKWDTLSDVKYFEIWRSTNRGTAILIDTVKYDSVFTDTSARPQLSRYAYYIIAIDSCNAINRSRPSQTDTVISLKLRTVFCTPEVSLQWTAYTGAPVKNYQVYRSTDKVIFNSLGSTLSSVRNFNDNTVTAGQPYYYAIEAITSTGYTSYSDTLGIIPSIVPLADSAQLVYATVIKSDEKNGAIMVKWRRDSRTDTNARGYYIYSLNPANGKYTLLEDRTNLNDTVYIDTAINTIQFSYQYYIVIYNVCDIGVNSKIHRPILLTVNNGDLKAQLNWRNYLGVPVKDYVVYKSQDGGQTFLLATPGTDTSLTDSNIYCTHSYTYQVQALLANKEITFSDSITIKAYDTVRPKTKPIELVTVTNTSTSTGKIKISWNPAYDVNLEGYNVFRSDDGFSWTRIRQVDSGNAMTDSLLNTYRQSYYYKIQPYDSCGNFGDYSLPHQSIQLKAQAKNSYDQLNWNSYQGWPVKAYVIYRDGKKIGSVSKDTLSFKDSLVYCDTVYNYMIVAIDSLDNTLFSTSNKDSVKAFDQVAPAKVYIKAVSVSKPNKAVTITWTRSTSWDVLNYDVYRKLASDGSMHLMGTTSDTIFIDSSGEVTQPDCYYVFANDHCQNRSNGSNNGCIMILSAKASTSSATGQNDLKWNGYQTWFDGVQNYNVYKNDDGQGWILIGTTSSGTVREFSDMHLSDSTINFCYQVEAVENPGQYNQLTRSTVECVHQDATIFIPNSFTPYNQDGVNDLFGPVGAYMKNYTMHIYNRWGEEVYVTSSGKAWDGNNKGQPVPQGIYIYYIEVQDYNGNVTRFKGNITMFE